MPSSSEREVLIWVQDWRVLRLFLYIKQPKVLAGLFLGPQMVGEALKGGRLLAEVFTRRGYPVHPAPNPSQTATPIPSFITAIQLGSSEKMQAFCRAVQRKSPVGSYVLPVPGKRLIAKLNAYGFPPKLLRFEEIIS